MLAPKVVVWNLYEVPSDGDGLNYLILLCATGRSGQVNDSISIARCEGRVKHNRASGLSTRHLCGRRWFT